MKNKTLLRILTVMLAVLLLSGCGTAVSSQTAPQADGAKTVTYTDLAGRTVKISKDVKRVVLIRARDIYELSALLGDGLGTELVGWGSDLEQKDKDGYDKYVEKFPELKSIPVIGDVQKNSIDLEKVVDLKPDLIIADQYMVKEYKCVQQLIDTGLPVVCLDQSSDPLKTPQDGVLLLGKILGKEERAQQIVQYVNDQITTVSTKLAGLNKPEPTVYFECGDTGPTKYSSAYAGADDQSWGSILSRLRVKNIGDSKGVDPQLSPEYVIMSNPDIIVITGQNWTTQADSMKLGFLATPAGSEKYLQAYLSRSGWSNLNAVKNKRVYSVFQNFSMHIYDFAGYQALAKFFYPDDFKDLDPEKNYRDFFTKFMPIDYSGVWMLSLD